VNLGKNGKWTGLNNIGENWKVEFEKTKTISPGKHIKKSEITDSEFMISDQNTVVKSGSGSGSDFSNDNKITFTLSCSDQGQVGVFPEQQENWKWINDSIRKSLQTEIAKKNQKEKEINPDTVISEDYVEVTDYSKISVNSRKNPPKIRTNNNSNSNSKKGKIVVEENVKNIPMRKILNGFAYTGGSSLAALLAYGSSDKNELSPSSSSSTTTIQNNGAVTVNYIPIEVEVEVELDVQVQVQVVHLDAAKSSVQWALRNAAASGLIINDGGGNDGGGSSESATESEGEVEKKEGGEEEKEEEDVDGRDASKSDDTENENLQSSSSSSSSSTPYSARWITDDCLSFLDREIRRGNRYDGLIFDPPAFGRASNGKIWKIEKDLPVLVEELIPKLLSEKPLFVLLSCHDVAWPPERLAESLSVAMSTVARNAMISNLKALKKNKANQPILDKDKSKNSNNNNRDKDSDKKKNNTTVKKAKIVLLENENSNIKSIVVAGGILEYGAMVLTPKQYTSSNIRKSEIGNPLPLGGFARWSAVVEE
jgi:hypothetical protein